MIQYMWEHTKNDRPYVILRNEQGEQASVMWWNSPGRDFFRVFLVHGRSPHRHLGSQRVEDFSTIETAFRFARLVLRC